MQAAQKKGWQRRSLTPLRALPRIGCLRAPRRLRRAGWGWVEPRASCWKRQVKRHIWQRSLAVD
jgi:hypothetical protein